MQMPLMCEHWGIFLVVYYGILPFGLVYNYSGFRTQNAL